MSVCAGCVKVPRQLRSQWGEVAVSSGLRLPWGKNCASACWCEHTEICGILPDGSRVKRLCPGWGGSDPHPSLWLCYTRVFCGSLQQTGAVSWWFYAPSSWFVRGSSKVTMFWCPVPFKLTPVQQPRCGHRHLQASSSFLSLSQQLWMPLVPNLILNKQPDKAK